jgi:hypothetical protein
MWRFAVDGIDNYLRYRDVFCDPLRLVARVNNLATGLLLEASKKRQGQNRLSGMILRVGSFEAALFCRNISQVHPVRITSTRSRSADREEISLHRRCHRAEKFER